MRNEGGAQTKSEGKRERKIRRKVLEKGDAKRTADSQNKLSRRKEEASYPRAKVDLGFFFPSEDNMLSEAVAAIPQRCLLEGERNKYKMKKTTTEV